MPLEFPTFAGPVYRRPANYPQEVGASAPNQDSDLGQVHSLYFQSEAAYRRVLRAKRRLDPADVFTSSPFCVGASRRFGGGSAWADGEAALAIAGAHPTTVGDRVGGGVVGWIAAPLSLLRWGGCCFRGS